MMARRLFGQRNVGRRGVARVRIQQKKLGRGLKRSEKSTLQQLLVLKELCNQGKRDVANKEFLRLFKRKFPASGRAVERLQNTRNINDPYFKKNLKQIISELPASYDWVYSINLFLSKTVEKIPDRLTTKQEEMWEPLMQIAIGCRTDLDRVSNYRRFGEK